MLKMALPSAIDLQKKKDFKASLEKKISGGNGRLTEKQMCSILRSNVRKTWMMSPVRLLKLEMARISDMNPDTRTKWLCECENCNGMFKMTDVETDHKVGEHQLLSLADAEQFTRSILDVTLDDLQIFCKPCHEIKTYAERYDMTFDQAKFEKAVIDWMKKVKAATAQKKFLLGVGFTEDEVSNGDNRRESYRKYLHKFVNVKIGNI
jgi:hypothetical protein